MNKRILQAYYDLAVAPPSFDICVFLYLAEMERLHRQLDAIDLIVVAHRDADFGRKMIYKPLNEIIWRLNHIVLPAHKLVPACRRAVYYPDREEAFRDFDSSKPIFPADYTLDRPVSRYFDSEILKALYAGRPFASLRASASALEMVKEWLDRHTGGRKPIPITLRSDVFQPGRNSNVREWIRFARALDRAIYQPIIVRDTAEVFKTVDPDFKDFLVFDPAALDIELRIALCELAHINLFVDSGPAVLCMLDDLTRCIRFKLSLENNPHVGLASFLRRGYSHGMQWAGTNTHQISVWEDDTAECIMREFTALERQLQAGAPPERRPLPPISLVAANMIAGRNYRDAITVATKAMADDPNDLEARYLLAISLMHADERRAAVKEFEELIKIPQMQNIVLIPFAECLWLTGRAKDAVALLLEASQRRPENIHLQKSIAQFLLKFDEEVPALDVLTRLVRAKPSDPEILKQYAIYLQNDVLTLPDAIEALDKALRQKPEDPSLHAMLGSCFAQLADYEKAIHHTERAIALKGGSTLRDWAEIGQWCIRAGDGSKARAFFLKASAAVDAHLDENVSPCNVIIDWLASKAQIDLSLGSEIGAHSCYIEILRRFGTDPHIYHDSQYLEHTPRRLERFRNIVGQRDVFIFCNGPSITDMDACWKSFAAANACLMAADSFHLFEAGFLRQTQATVDVAIATHYRTLRRSINEFLAFLARDSQNLLITRRQATDRLGTLGPTREALEAHFDEKLLYFGGMSHITPATPFNPLCFLNGNPLSILLVLATIAGARRIFIFGADGTVPTDTRQMRHCGFDRGRFRIEVAEKHVPIVRKVLAAEAMSIGHVATMGFLAAKHLFGVEPPQIYNVSPGSVIDAFPRLTYDEALEMLAIPQTTGAVNVLQREGCH